MRDRGIRIPSLRATDRIGRLPPLLGPIARARRWTLRLPIVGLLCACVASLAAQSASAAPVPAAIIHRLDPDAEERQRELREAWLESMHRAAPGVNWREIEAANAMESFLHRESRAGVMSGPWSEIGAANVTGRTHVTQLAPNGIDLYVGSELGGVWSGTTSGGPWTPRSDGVGAGVHSLVITPGPPEVMLTATNGGRLFYSADAGASWHVPTGLPDYVWECIRLIREPGSQRVYAMLEGWRWIGVWDHSYQLYRSSNGGVTFTYLRSDPMATRPDLWMDRRTPGRPLFLLVGDALKRSTDFGASFANVGTIPASGDRVTLVGSEAGAPTLYAALHVGSVWKLFRSLDAGATWAYRSDLADYWESLCASITNPDAVFCGGVDGARSMNGGASFALINHWYDYYGDPAHMLHADIMGIDAIPRPSPAGESIYFNTDGGTFVSDDLGASFRNLTQDGFRNSQYYSILTSRTDSRLIAAGSQDQGYQLSTPSPSGPLEFTQIISGDYGHLTSSSGTHDLLWSAYPGFLLLQLAEGGGLLDYPEFPPNVGAHSWMPNILADPGNPNRLYFCADHLWRIERSPGSVYSYTMLPHNFAQTSGEYLTAFAISPVDANYWYAATDQGRLWYSHDAGANWYLSASPGPGAHYFYGTELLPSPTEAAVCFVGGSGYSNPGVYRTVSGGVSWTAYGTGQPSTLVYGLALNNSVEQVLYAATEAGPYRHDPATGTWTSLLAGSCCAPQTVYWDVEALPSQATIRFATHGRGIWDYATGSLVSAGPPAAAPDVRLSVYPSPARKRTTIDFQLPRAGNVRVEVFDVAGHRIATLADGELASGSHRVEFGLKAANGRPLESGIYLVRAAMDGAAEVRKLLVRR